MFALYLQGVFSFDGIGIHHVGYGYRTVVRNFYGVKTKNVEKENDLPQQMVQPYVIHTVPYRTYKMKYGLNGNQKRKNN